MKNGLKIKSISIKLEKYEKGQEVPYEVNVHKISPEVKKDATN